jgi:hypothetical protein
VERVNAMHQQSLSADAQAQALSLEFQLVRKELQDIRDMLQTLTVDKYPDQANVAVDYQATESSTVPETQPDRIVTIRLADTSKYLCYSDATDHLEGVDMTHDAATTNPDCQFLLTGSMECHIQLASDGNYLSLVKQEAFHKRHHLVTLTNEPRDTFHIVEEDGIARITCNNQHVAVLDVDGTWVLGSRSVVKDVQGRFVIQQI